MKSMNLFGDSTSKATTKPKKKTYTEDFKKKAIKLAYQFGVTKAAEELGISTSSIHYWKKLQLMDYRMHRSKTKKVISFLTQKEELTH